MPRWFIIATVLVAVVSYFATRLLYRRSEAHQMTLGPDAQFASLRRFAWRFVNAFAVIFWYVTVSMFLISDAVDQQEQDRVAGRRASCRAENSGYQASRDDMSNVLALLVAQSDDPETAQATFDQIVNDVLTQPEEVDSDCDADCQLDDDDYGRLRPADLPIPVQCPDDPPG